MIYYFLLCLIFTYQVNSRPSSSDASRLSNRDQPAVLRMCRRQLSTGSPNCKAMIKRWHYDSQSQLCKPFGWSGCGGNNNRFESREECESRCQGVPACRPSRARPGPSDCLIFRAIGIADGCPNYHFDCQERPRNSSCGPVPDFGPLPKDCRIRTITTLAGCPKDVVTCPDS